MIFGQKLRELRKAHNNMSQSQLAEHLQVSLRTVRGWELEGRSPKSVALYQKIADLFECDLNVLMSDNSSLSYPTTPVSSTEEIRQLTNRLAEHFTSGSLSANEMDIIMKTLQNAYWQAKGTPDTF